MSTAMVQTPQEESQNWPLAAPPKVTADGVNGNGVRPSTSDGTETVTMRKSMRRPEGMQRSQSEYDTGSVKPAAVANGAVYSERTGKKKKFGGLRKLFGLHD